MTISALPLSTPAAAHSIAGDESANQGQQASFIALAQAAPTPPQPQPQPPMPASLGDPLYPHQWHLKNTGQHGFGDILPVAGIDLNLGTLHEQGITGQGVLVGVQEGGRIDAGHEDLAANLLARDPVPSLESSAHATAIAGIIAAVAGNGKGGRGVAPGAKIVDMGAPSVQGGVPPRLQNMSVGNSPILFMPYSGAKHPDTDLNLQGGAVMFKAAGNEFALVDSAGVSAAMCGAITRGTGIGCVNASADPLSALAQSVTVAAVNASGKKASYSNAGSAIWVSGLGGEYGFEKKQAGPAAVPDSLKHVAATDLYSPAIVTTDTSGIEYGMNRDGAGGPRFNRLDSGSRSKIDGTGDYTASANGTSAAAPTVTGVAALMLQVNPDLTWRDIKYILATTARKIDPEQRKIDWQGLRLDNGWTTNAAGRAFSNWYGFGLVDATAAVRKARDYTPLGPLRISSGATAPPGGIPIAGNGTPDAPGASGASGASITVAEDVKIETVQMRLRTTHKDPYGLHIVLTSPSGTQSIIQPALTLSTKVAAEFSIDLVASNAFLDESARGKWTLQVIDALHRKPSSVITSWDLRVLGH